jgi:uncharacterized SAM-dependent methyltransferase
MIMNREMESVFSLIRSISDLMNQGDYLVFGVDANQDKETALRGYKDNECMDLDCMRYFKYKFNLDGFDPEQFKFVLDWVPDEANKLNCIKFNVEALCDQEFEYKEKGFKFKVNKSDKYFLFRGNKFRREFFASLGPKFGLELKEVVQDSNDRVKLFFLMKN